VLKSSYFFVQINVATMDPAELPEIIFGRTFNSLRVLATPKWYMPRRPPPLKIKAVLPSACLVSTKNSCFF